MARKNKRQFLRLLIYPTSLGWAWLATWAFLSIWAFLPFWPVFWLSYIVLLIFAGISVNLSTLSESEQRGGDY